MCADSCHRSLAPPTSTKLLFHTHCLRCAECDKPLGTSTATHSTASNSSSSAEADAAAATAAEVEAAEGGGGVYPHAGHVYCRTDYLKRFGPKCQWCKEIIPVRRAAVLCCAVLLWWSCGVVCFFGVEYEGMD
jgi:hypothetical protein